MFDEATDIGRWVLDHGQAVAPGWAQTVVAFLLGCIAVTGMARWLMVSLGLTATESATFAERISSAVRRWRKVLGPS